MAWTPREATDGIRKIARSPSLALSYKLHATQRLVERGIIVSDVLYALKNGFVQTEPVPASRPTYNRYLVECRTPNSGARDIGVVVIPDTKGCLLKVVTVMWMDETGTKAGSVIGD